MYVLIFYFYKTKKVKLKKKQKQVSKLRGIHLEMKREIVSNNMSFS